jgi:hypothetical protein
LRASGWNRNPEYLKKITDLPQASDKQSCIKYTSLWWFFLEQESKMSATKGQSFNMGIWENIFKIFLIETFEQQY